jgi:cysteine-rich repeat protein
MSSRREAGWLRTVFFTASVVFLGSLLTACPYEFPPLLSGVDGGDDDAEVECGNGVVQGDEECDDQNTVSGDGCNALCEEEEGWTCDGAPSTCSSVCGDGLVVGDEECDDGNTEPGDGCNGGCLVECSNGSVSDCNASGTTLEPGSAYVDPDPPEGFIQCAGFMNTSADDVSPDWEIDCLGTERVLRLRYWDTSEEPWILLGDATLSPASTAAYEQQTFDATDHGGTEGVDESQGVVFLKDAPGTLDPSVEVCDNPGNSDDYAATDLYLENRVNTKKLWVCSVDDDSTDKPCPPEAELIFVAAQSGTCITSPGDFVHLALALYYLKDG